MIRREAEEIATPDIAMNGRDREKKTIDLKNTIKPQRDIKKYVATL